MQPLLCASVVFFVYALGENLTTYSGFLTPMCVSNYFRIYVTRRIPPRNYQYYHEILTGNELQLQFDSNTTVEPNWRIVGGNAISITEAPYQVMYGRYCGGALIAPEWVITAAHCKEKADFISAGSTFRNEGTEYKICAHFIHPLWSKSNEHIHDFDYQLILLERPVPITPNSRPIAIGSTDDIRPGVMVAVTGWGFIQYKHGKMENALRRVFVPIIPRAECKELPNIAYKNITERMFCAGYLDGKKDSCQGDSGGPAMSGGKLIGLVSFGVGCAMKDHPGVYSKIPLVRDWIRHITSLPI